MLRPVRRTVGPLTNNDYSLHCRRLRREFGVLRSTRVWGDVDEMPQGNTSAARIISDNLDYRERGGLRLADALRIHAALHEPSAPSVTISTGHTLPIDSGGETGVRRCLVIVDAERPRGRRAALSNASSWQPSGLSRLALAHCCASGLWAHVGRPRCRPQSRTLRSPGGVATAVE